MNYLLMHPPSLLPAPSFGKEKAKFVEKLRLTIMPLKRAYRKFLCAMGEKIE